jgi:hypothetical protein
MYPPQSAQSLLPEVVHLPDSIPPDEGSCTLQSLDLSTPGLDLLSGWESGLPVSDDQSLMLAQGLDAWLQFEHPDDVSIVDGADALDAGDPAEHVILPPECSMAARPGELSPQAEDLLQQYQQAAPGMYPADQMDQQDDFSHRVLRFGLLDRGLEQ